MRARQHTRIPSVAVSEFEKTSTVGMMCKGRLAMSRSNGASRDASAEMMPKRPLACRTS